MAVSKSYEIGDKFGMLTLVSELEKHVSPCGQTKRKFLFKCECGDLTEQLMNNVSRGKVVSCGCYGKSLCITHGRTSSSEYSAWRGMLRRCKPELAEDFPHHAGKGIKVCDRWNPRFGGSFENFYEDMGESPEGTSLDRIDGDSDYSPENCRWATNSMQAFNKAIKNTLGCPGVQIKGSRYYVYITKDGKDIYLGNRGTIEEAKELRREAELKYFGEIKTKEIEEIRK